jgi:hypothetical protein
MEALTLLIVSVIILAFLGVVIAFSPTLMLTLIAILTRSKKPFLDSLFLIAGIGLSVTIFSIGTMLFVDPAKVIELPSTTDVLGRVPLVDIIAGILLLVVGLRLLRPTNDKRQNSQKSSEYTMNPKTLFWFGFIKMSTSLSSVAAIIIASRFIKTYYTFNTAQFAAILWLVCISLSPFLLLIAAKKYRPQLFKKIQNASDRVSTLDWRRLLAGVVLIASISFLMIGMKNI